MARYILIDNNSGYILGDTSDFAAGRQSDITTISDVAKIFDESIGETGRTYVEFSRNPHPPVLHVNCFHGSAYVEFSRNPHTAAIGYDIYRADVCGSDAVAAIQDGQDQEIIEAVIRDCEYVGFVECNVPGA